MASYWKVLTLLLLFCFLLVIESTADQTAVNDSKPRDDYYNPPFDPLVSSPLYSKAGTRLVTLNELAVHGSVNGTLRPYWLAIMGRVYDVDKGERHYGPDGGYSFFTGCDGTKAFVTGEFNDDGLTDDTSELTPEQLLDIDGWVQFYEKDYTFVGKLIGRYYDKNGNPTKAYYKYMKRLEKGREIKSDKEADEKEFPPCNSRFTQSTGGTVSCSTKRYLCTCTCTCTV